MICFFCINSSDLKCLFANKKQNSSVPKTIIYRCSWRMIISSHNLRISTVLQIGNVSIISEAYRRLFNFGADTPQRDYDFVISF